MTLYLVYCLTYECVLILPQLPEGLDHPADTLVDGAHHAAPHHLQVELLLAVAPAALKSESFILVKCQVECCSAWILVILLHLKKK